MGITNASYQVRYIDDFGNVHPHYKIRNSAVAPKWEQVKGVAGYTERGSGVSCGSTNLFKARRLKVVFNNGKTIEYIVPRVELIDDMVKVLKPSLLNNLIPGEGDNEAACIHLIGERWSFVPPGQVGLSQGDFRKTPITGVQDTGSQKTTYLYKYTSEIPTVGEINTSFAVHIDSETLRNCQVEGMSNWEAKDQSNPVICRTNGLGISPRHFIIKTLLEFDSNGIIPGGKNRFKGVRQAPIDNTGKAKSVARAIADCAYCLGWKGESARNVHLLLGSNIAGNDLAR